MSDKKKKLREDIPKIQENSSQEPQNVKNIPLGLNKPGNQKKR